MDEIAIFTETLDANDVNILYQNQGSSTIIHESTYLSPVIDSNFEEGVMWKELRFSPTSPIGKAIPINGGDESDYDINGLSPSLLSKISGHFAFDSESAAYSDSEAIGQQRGESLSLIVNDAGASGLGINTGKFAQPLNFDGTDDFLQADSAKDSYSLAANKSVAFWLNPHTLLDNTFVIGHLADGESEADNANFLINLNAEGQIIFGHEYGNGSDELHTSSCYLSPNSWNNHIVLTRSSTGEYHLFYNGRSCTGGTGWDFSGNAPSGGENGKLQIGHGESGSPYYDGLIDELSFFDQPLDIASARALYQRGAGFIRLQVKACEQSDCSDSSEFVGPDGTNSSYFSDSENLTSGYPIGHLDSLELDSRYFQYKVFILTIDSKIKPGLKNIQIKAERH